MPVYEYKCSACGQEFEYQQRMSDAPKDLCEACGGKLERLISRTAFQLKGGGWYKDLYSSAKPGDASKSSGGAAATPSSDSSSGSSGTTSSGSGTGTGTGTGTGSGTGTGGGSSTAAAAAPAK
jgi:putative FmdB family regulatory protein